jgi:hypothetical protein
VPLARPIERVLELLQLLGPADEACEPSPRRGVEPSPGGAGPHQLEHLNGLGEPLARGARHGLAGSPPPWSLALLPAGRTGSVKVNVDPWPT